MDSKRSFGQWVKQRRQALDLTQQELAQRIGCALSTLQKIERAARQPSRELAELLADHFDLTADERTAFLSLARGRPVSAPPPLPLDPAARQPINNLPNPLTALIGREWEVTALCAWLSQADVRLVTITGPPGIGKTRLCLQTATQAHTQFADGVCFVPLAAISESRFVISAIARALEVKDTGSQLLLERVKVYLHDRQLLLVLDNFEHLLPATPWVVELLEAAPYLKILTTSRATLQVYGEHEFVARPLALPDLNQLPAPDRLQHYAAVTLFIQRVRAVQPEFTLSAANARTVAEICIRLEGLPLAIELAAARTKLFSPQTLLARLQDALTPQLTLLTGAHHLLNRHRTMRDAIAWSYALLNPTEQRLFRALGVFAGRCTLEALAAVVDKQLSVSSVHLPMTADHWLLQTVESLVNQSLVTQVAEPGQEPRFSVLEMIREYALEQLEQHGEIEVAQRAHATYFLQLAQKYESAHAEGRGRTEVVFISTEQEIDNLRAALHWAITHDLALGLHLTTAMTGFWSSRHYLDEGRQWLERLLPRLKADLPLFTTQQLTQYAHFLSLLAFITWQQGDLALAQVRFAESITLWQQIHNQLELGMALQFQALISFNQGDYLAAHISAQESVVILRAIDESWQLAVALKTLGRIRLIQGNAIAARTLIAESIDIMQRWGNRWGVSNGLLALSEVAFAQDDYCSALAYLEEALQYYRATNETWFLAQTLLALGKVCWRQGNKVQAAALWDESILLAHEAGAKQFLSGALFMSGLAAQENDEFPKARTLFSESLTLFQAMENQVGVAYSLSGLASMSGQAEQTTRLLGVASTVLDTARLPMDQIERAYYEQTVAAVRGQLDEATFAAAWAQGQALSLAEAIGSVGVSVGQPWLV